MREAARRAGEANQIEMTKPSVTSTIAQTAALILPLASVRPPASKREVAQADTMEEESWFIRPFIICIVQRDAYALPMGTSGQQRRPQTMPTASQGRTRLLAAIIPFPTVYVKK